MSYAPVHYSSLSNSSCGCAGFGQTDAAPAPSNSGRTATLVFGGIMVGLGFLAYLRFKTTADIARTRGVNEALKYEAGMAGIQAARRLVSRNKRGGRRRRH